MSTTEPVTDPTFRSYTSDQAKLYASGRPSYGSAVYDLILKHHSETGGQFNLLLDLGCGPGQVACDLAPTFERAYGVDAGAAMIERARQRGGNTKSGSAITFEVSPAETFSQVEGLEPESVDLLTVATAVRALWDCLNFRS
jgi:ubiquinone/menaquinone biosynthesis C-methylase UbiE